MIICVIVMLIALSSAEWDLNFDNCVSSGYFGDINCSLGIFVSLITIICVFFCFFHFLKSSFFLLVSWLGLTFYSAALEGNEESSDGFVDDDVRVVDLQPQFQQTRTQFVLVKNPISVQKINDQQKFIHQVNIQDPMQKQSQIQQQPPIKQAPQQQSVVTHNPQSIDKPVVISIQQQPEKIQNQSGLQVIIDPNQKNKVAQNPIQPQGIQQPIMQAPQQQSVVTHNPQSIDKPVVISIQQQPVNIQNQSGLLIDPNQKNKVAQNPIQPQGIQQPTMVVLDVTQRNIT